jgi:hypothetical protein
MNQIIHYDISPLLPKIFYTRIINILRLINFLQHFFMMMFKKTITISAYWMGTAHQVLQQGR